MVANNSMEVHIAHAFKVMTLNNEKELETQKQLYSLETF